MSAFNTIEEAIEDIRNGKMIVVVDDKRRENEGDLIMAAELVTPQAINFMAKFGGGLICMPIVKERLTELNIGMMVVDNTDTHKTAFTVSVDAAETTTGISAHERAFTIKKIIDPDSKSEDFNKPGHIFPLESKKGGVLVRAGHTEAAVDAGAHALFFPCGTGHMMGLDVHDMENLGEQWVGYDGVPKSTQFGLKSLRLGKTLRPGFVLTIEPGIYFIPDLIDRWKAEKHLSQYLNYSEIEKFRNFSGLRNEEDFVITEEGARQLGKALPLSIDGVESLRS